MTLIAGQLSAVGNRIVAAIRCPHCRETFEPRRRDQLYCSGRCRTAACRERKRALR